MGRYCCKRDKLIDIMRKKTDKSNPMSREEILKIMRTDAIDRKTFSTYVNETERLENEDDNGRKGTIVPISAGRNTKYYYEPGADELVEEETCVILDGVFSLKGVSPELKKSIKRKVLSQVGERVQSGFASYDDRICVVSNDDALGFVNRDVLKSLTRAIQEKKCVMFDYYRLTPQKVKVPRYRNIVVYPQALYVNDGFYYLIAYSPEKDANRNYRLMRMGNVVVCDDSTVKVPPKYQFRYKEFYHSNFGMYNGKAAVVTLKAKIGLADQMYDKFGDYDFISQTAEDFTFKVKVELGRTFYGWLCGYEGDVKIVEPQSEIIAFNAYLDKLKF